ncbi:MAG TPA: dephospho-CoA kinase [Syntrophorhabdaceae bacterium]|jgi:dephospho-CoA kinase|nr:Dephospho-CoA kinase [Syntrophorhabdaceae bacterium]HNQ62413.1 dephospho-CoA kinase [Syntrophorhabdaceae bacterium]HOB68398.1 dephospho-CoA kinase [Syntrophorhabdaceae bacterium]HOF57213.1 dephospho-CoA kinase [Syntrophorhabdaceae bacterium]HOS05219.1 dephospho-CoA kinase [Syntrophorhabdaceae bacterium]
MILIGITGIIGSGKTTVSNMLEKEGFVVIDLDRIAKDTLLQNDVIREIGSRFGKEYVSGDRVNVEKMKKTVFQNEDMLRILEGITHPKIVDRLFNDVDSIKKRGAKSIIIDGPLLFETGLYKRLDKIVVVSANPEALKERLIKRGMEQEDIEKRMVFQISLEEKEKLADIVLYNNGTMEGLKREVSKLSETIKGWEVEIDAPE